MIMLNGDGLFSSLCCHCIGKVFYKQLATPFDPAAQRNASCLNQKGGCQHSHLWQMR